MSAVEQYYTTNLPLRNYTITNTEADNFGITMDFERDGLVGELTFQEETSIQVTTVVLKLNPPS